MKILLAFTLICIISGCNNDSAGSNTMDSTQTEIGGVENVNGNIPDTTSGGGTPNSGDNSSSIDSSYADTANKKQ